MTLRPLGAHELRRVLHEGPGDLEISGTALGPELLCVLGWRYHDGFQRWTSPRGRLVSVEAHCELLKKVGPVHAANLLHLADLWVSS